ncbi:hypothetical protein [Bradyrhizobium sp. AZCC 2289]|uniref:hypothetical protein n=1 Tax=Bradyrhizobium sp. AZCC 2289 TaxID=3117026 RepID=UPI002FEE815C
MHGRNQRCTASPAHDATLGFSANIGNWPFGEYRSLQMRRSRQNEVMFRPLKALAEQTEQTGNRIGPELPRLKQKAGVPADFFGPSSTLLTLPRACARGVVVARTGRL